MLKYIIENISKSYVVSDTETLTIFKDLSFNIVESKILSIVGASGVGKSTLLHIIGSIDKPSSGKLNYTDDDLDLDIINSNEKQLNKFRNEKLGFIFQFHHLLPEFTALENVMIPALISNRNKKDSENKAKELLDFVGISHRLDHKPKKMSGGEQQRVAIARSIINNPKILIADEPTGNLDEKNSEVIATLFHKINKEFGTTILTATHSKEFAQIADERFELRPTGLFLLS